MYEHEGEVMGQRGETESSGMEYEITLKKNRHQLECWKCVVQNSKAQFFVESGRLSRAKSQDVLLFFQLMLGVFHVLSETKTTEV